MQILSDLAIQLSRESGLTAVQNSGVDVQAIENAAAAMRRASASLEALPPATSRRQWSPISRRTKRLDDEVTDVTQRLRHAEGMAHLTARLFGRDGRTRVVIAFQNNAEMRDQGMVLSYAVAEGEGGLLVITQSGSIADLAIANAVSDVVVPKGTQQIFGALQPLQLWQSVNATADIALAGRTMASMYRHATGKDVDAVVTIDVPTLARVLSLTGPVHVNGFAEPLTHENLAPTVLNAMYATTSSERGDREARQARLAAILSATIQQLESSQISAPALARLLGEAAAGRGFSLTSTNDEEQELLETVGLSGAPGLGYANETFHIAVQNGTATKLDWFVDPAISVSVDVTPDGAAVVRVSVEVPNDAPLPTPRSEQFGPDGYVTTTPGHYRARVYFWGPSTGEQLDSVSESGLRLNTQTVDVFPGESKTVRFSTIIPNAIRGEELRFRFVPQPRARPTSLVVRVRAPGRHIRGPSVRRVELKRTMTLSWSIEE